jgi:hypothetical protein
MGPEPEKSEVPTEPKLYAERDVRAFGEFYVKHVAAMTRESLHSKSDIAAELAWRDIERDRLQQCIYEQGKEITRLRHQIASMKHGHEQYNLLADFVIKNRLWSKGTDKSHTEDIIDLITKLRLQCDARGERN